jgi:phage terminase small subunit
MTLTPKQEAFVLAYIGLGNASVAYRRAFNAAKMKPNTVEKRACELLKNGKVMGRIAELRGKAADKAVLTRAWVLERLMRSARIAMGEERITVAVRPKSAPDTAVELEITDRDAGAANRALELLGKADEVRLFQEQKEGVNSPLRPDGPREIGPEARDQLFRRFAGGPRDPSDEHYAALERRFGSALRIHQTRTSDGVSEDKLNAAARSG